MVCLPHYHGTIPPFWFRSQRADAKLDLDWTEIGRNSCLCAIKTSVRFLLLAARKLVSTAIVVTKLVSMCAAKVRRRSRRNWCNSTALCGLCINTYLACSTLQFCGRNLHTLRRRDSQLHICYLGAIHWLKMIEHHGVLLKSLKKLGAQDPFSCRIIEDSCQNYGKKK
jgi:hypothetical protein